MSSVGVWAAIPLIVLAGRVASLTRKYGICAFLFMVPYPILTGVFRHLQQQGNSTEWTRYGVYQSMVAVGCPPYILGVIWVAANARTPTQRSVTSALYVMLTNAANSFATQMFRESDKPKYLKGLIGVLTFQSLGCLLLLTALGVFWFSNKHELGDAGLPAITAEVDVPEGQEIEEVTVAKKFKYAL